MQKLMQKIILGVALLFTVIISFSLIGSVLYSQSAITNISLLYIAFIASAILCIYLMRRYKFKFATFLLFTVSFTYQTILNHLVLFWEEADLRFLFDTAVNLATRNFEYPNLYGAVFPAGTTYSAFLSIFMKIFSTTSRYIPVLINHFAISAMVCVTYLYLKKKMSNTWALIGGFLLILHPFMLIYSNTCNAELLFGTSVLFSYYSFEMAENSSKLKNKYLWIIITSLWCGFANFFRPLSAILVCAYIIYICFFMMGNFKLKIKTCSILLVVFCLIRFASQAVIVGVTGYEYPNNAYGWNLYVGSSESGQWSLEDSNTFSTAMDNSKNPHELHKYFTKKALERYRNIKFKGFHCFKKLTFWFATEYISSKVFKYGDYVFNEAERGAIFAIVAMVDISIFFLALISCAWILIKRKNDSVAVLIFYLLGSFIALMFLEVAPRYTTSYRMLFCLLSIRFIAYRKDQVESIIKAKSR